MCFKFRRYGGSFNIFQTFFLNVIEKGWENVDILVVWVFSKGVINFSFWYILSILFSVYYFIRIQNDDSCGGDGDGGDDIIWL